MTPREIAEAAVLKDVDEEEARRRDLHKREQQQLAIEAKRAANLERKTRERDVKELQRRARLAESVQHEREHHAARIQASKDTRRAELEAAALSKFNKQREYLKHESERQDRIASKQHEVNAARVDHEVAIKQEALRQEEELRIAATASKWERIMLMQQRCLSRAEEVKCVEKLHKCWGDIEAQRVIMRGQQEEDRKKMMRETASGKEADLEAFREECRLKKANRFRVGMMEFADALERERHAEYIVSLREENVTAKIAERELRNFRLLEQKGLVPPGTTEAIEQRQRDGPAQDSSQGSPPGSLPGSPPPPQQSQRSGSPDESATQSSPTSACERQGSPPPLQQPTESQTVEDHECTTDSAPV